MYSLALAFWLFSLLSAVSPAFAFPTRTFTGSRRWTSTPFVTASGTRLSVNGKEFTFVGTNAYWLPYLNSEDDISNTLANMSQSGITVVRTWAFNDVPSVPDAGFWLQLIKDGKTSINTGPDGFQRLDKFIELAKKHNIYVYFSLTNNWFASPNDSPSQARRGGVTPSALPRNFLSNNYGGMDAYVQEFGVAKTHDEFYTNTKIREEFNNYVQFVVSRYANEPGIIAWELANDARCSSTLPSSELCNTNIVTQWHADTAKFVHSADPNHLVTSGNHGFFCPSCPKLFTPSPPPPPQPSPAPGKTSKRTAGGLMTLSKLFQMVTNERRASFPSLGTREGMKIRGHWTAPAGAKRQSDDGGLAFNGAFGVDSQDILNAPHIDFGTFQLFPDQNNYGTTGAEGQPPSTDFDTTLSQSFAWIRAQADSANTIGKPVVLTAFGLVTQDNLAQFIPFNATCPLEESQSSNQYQKRQDFGTVGTGVTTSEVVTAYTSWFQVGLQAGLNGMNQYQWSSQGLTSGSGTVVQSPNAGGTYGSSPNDGYGILGSGEAQVQQTISEASQNTT